MTTIRAAAPLVARRPVVQAAAAPAAKPAQAVKPAQPIRAQGAVETGAKIIGGAVGAVAGAGGGTAIGLIAFFLTGAAGNPIGTSLIALSGLGFGALGAWAGWKNGEGIGQIIEGFFK